MGKGNTLFLTAGSQLHKKARTVFLQGREILTGHQGIDLQHSAFAEMLLNDLAAGSRQGLVIHYGGIAQGELEIAVRIVGRAKDVSLVLGTYGSSSAIAGGPIFGEAGLAAIGVTCTNPNVTAGNDYYFRICFLDPFQGTVLANFAQDKFSAKKAYCLGELGNDYDQGLVKYFTDAFDGEVITDAFPTNTSDFSTYLAKAKDQGAEVIFCPVSIAYATQIIKLAASMGLEIPILGSDTLDSNKVLEAAAGSDVQLYVSTFYQEGGSPEFDDGIKAWMNEDSTAMTNNGGNDTIAAVTAMGYDAYYVALEALKAAGSTDPAAVKAALPGVTYTGVTGVIAFDDIGDAIRDTAYIKVADTANNAWALETMQKAG